MEKTYDFSFELINETQTTNAFTAECSGSRSDCCTRVCTRDDYQMSEAEWGQFLKVDSGVIQY